MIRPLTADTLTTALAPLLTAQGWDAKGHHPDGRTLHVGETVAGRVTVFVRQVKVYAGEIKNPVLLQADVTSVEQTVGLLRYAGVLPGVVNAAVTS